LPVPVLKVSPGARPPEVASCQLTDMHFHTRWSDGRATPAEAVERARTLGVRVAITDHNVVGGAVEAWALAGEEARERVLPGIELTTQERVHLLVYFDEPGPLEDFFERVVRPHQRRGFTPTAPSALWSSDLLEALERGRYPSFTAAPHPFAAGLNGYMSARERFAHVRDEVEHLDALEVLNGEEIETGNARSRTLAQRTRKPVVAGSDGHVLSELGRVAVATPAGEPLFDALRARKVHVVDRRAGTWALVLGHGAKVPYHAAKPFRAAMDFYTRRDQAEIPVRPRRHRARPREDAA